MFRFAPRRMLGLLATVLLTAAITFPLGVLASHQFADVPDGNTYHNDIDAIADAGVTTGCGGGNYCPSAYVTREQMAAFMNRLGALAPGKTPVVNADKVDGLTSSQFLRSDSANPGRLVCSVQSFRAQSSVTPWASDSTRIWASSATDASFYCPVLIPDGATVTSVDWRVFDSTAADGIDCALIATDSVAGSVMASGTSSAADSPGWTTLSDTTIAGSVIDNELYSYAAGCTVQASGTTTALHRVEIEYLLVGLPIP